MTIVAVINDEIVGFGDISHSRYLNHLFVSYEHQRRSIDILICNHLESSVKSQSITTDVSITAILFLKRETLLWLKNTKLLGMGFLL
ncbi:predicted acetyltransferase [Alteracholeplasma palmae J233]|uniref:Predicted acetyltransferase n=1 Tax=Alteracholeplasma palmae (strain ATCC 49389 / J233) TaxID=1318466 RepID=U4KRT7_ALTPJ|nr:predicted acetyltransferase [Alteracholeplasma palmae J233]